MSELSEFTNPGKDGPIPGLTLSAPGLVQYAKAEEHFKDEYFNGVKRQLTGLPAKVVAEAVTEIQRDMVHGPFRFPSQVFNACALARTNLPYLVLWSLQVKHDDMTLAKVIPLLANAENLSDIAAEVYKLWGYDFEKKPVAAGSPTATIPSTGEPSSGGVAEQPPTDSDLPPTNMEG